MPLWKLQTVGQGRLDFLYESAGAGNTIELLPGVAYCFRRFHALITDLVRGAWVRYVRQQNLNILGETADLNEFLFGSERAPLAVVRPALIDIQRGRCFYCGKSLSQPTTHVDHFIAWARYPVDLGHNFVLADSRCNSQKRDRLAAYNHLAAWTERNRQYGDQIGTAMEERGIVSELASSNRVAQWAYAQTEATLGLTWLRADTLEHLAPGWRDLF
jgi:5-methylcytosine-specific restriction endonuclease McrA